MAVMFVNFALYLYRMYNTQINRVRAQKSILILIRLGLNNKIFYFQMRRVLLYLLLLRRMFDCCKFRLMNHDLCIDY